MKAVDYCAAYLADRGVRRAYGILGTQTLDLMEALHRAGLQFVPTQHEAAAGHMAAVEGQLTGVPGVCLVTQGPGSTNLATAVANAALDRSPLLVLAGARGIDLNLTVSYQTLPLVAAFEPISKWAVELKASNVKRVLPSAFEAATAPRPGPVFLKLPISEGQKEVDERPVPFQPPLPCQDESYATALELTAARLREARRPAIVAGIGVTERGADQALRRLAEELGAPVAVSPRAKGHFPADHSLFVGTYGARGDGAIHGLLDSADLVLLAGLDGVEFEEPRPFKAHTISLATVGADDAVFRPDIPINGELAASLASLAAGARSRHGWTTEEIATCREQVIRAVVTAGSDGLAPETVVRLLREETPRETIAVCDMEAHRALFCQAWSSYEPRTFLAATGLSAMGFGLPAAMAATIVRPELPVVCVVGEGGLLTCMGELWTLARRGLAVTVVVMADGGSTSMRIKQEGPPPTALRAGPGRPDYAVAARGFGLETVRVDGTEACRAAIRRAMTAGGPFLIQADVNPEEYP